MTAYINIITNAEGSHRLDLDDIVIHNDGLLEYLIYYLFDEDDGLHASLPEEDRDMREVYVRESGFIIESVDDDDGIAEHFFRKHSDSIGSFDLESYTEVMDLIDGPNIGFNTGAIAAYLSWTNGDWSRSDFESTYEGEYPNDRMFVEERVGDDDIPEWIRPYIDWDSFTSYMMADYHEEAGHYFSCY